MRGGRVQPFSAAWLIPLLVAALALALPTASGAAGTGSIAGTVSAEGGGALTGASVCAEGTGGTAAEFECVETALGGAYKIGGLAPGQYKVSFSAPSEANYAPQYYNDERSWETASPVTVGAGETAGIDAVLAKGAKITGVVTAAASGSPVAEVEVCAVSTDEAGFGCGRTNALGTYVIQGLLSGTYEVEFSTYETGQNLLSQRYAGQVPLLAGGEAKGVNAILQAGGQISGTVRTAATGTSLKGVEVCLTEASEAWVLACLKTPATGAYRFIGLWTGSFKVVFSPEASELEEGEYLEIPADAYPTEWWNGQSTFVAATPIGVTAPALVSGIDGSLGPGPVVSPPAPSTSPTPPATVVVKPKPKVKPLRCHRGFAKRKVKGKARCVRRHEPRRHARKHHPKPHKSSHRA